MTATLDHLLWGGPDLSAALAALEQSSGVRAAFGGQHPELGTQNAVAALGRRSFLEVIAPDPALPAGALAQKLASLAAPTLLMWAARIDDPATVATRAEAEGYQATIVPGERRRADGSVVRWTNVFVSGHGAGVLVPFFIAWNGSPHPADEAPTGLKLRRFVGESPQPAGVGAVLEALDVRLTVRRGPKMRLLAELDTPRGAVTLASDA